MFVAHDIRAFALAGLLVVKLRRGWRRLTTPAECDRLVKPGVLATHVGDEPMSHRHGAPLRLVAPGRRGFEWVVRIELHAHGDAGAAASTVWSSLTARGRGAT